MEYAFASSPLDGSSLQEVKLGGPKVVSEVGDDKAEVTLDLVDSGLEVLGRLVQAGARGRGRGKLDSSGGGE